MKTQSISIDDIDAVNQSLYWFIEQGKEEDLIQITQIETEISIDPDRLPVYANNPELIELLQTAKESIIARVVKQKSPNIYQLAEEVFIDKGAIARWFISSKQFLNGKTPFACLKDAKSLQLIETKLQQSLAGVCA